MLLKDIKVGTPSGLAFEFTDLNGKAIFTADDGVHGTEAWISDGTPGGTTLLSDINPGPSGSSIEPFFVDSGLAYFAADDGVTGLELWSTDGTSGGTVLATEFEAGPTGISGIDFWFLDGISLIKVGSPTHGSEPWALGPFTQYGEGCPGTGGVVPTLTPSGDTGPGGTITLDIAGGPAGAPAFLMVGVASSNLPVCVDCNLLVDPILFLPIVLSGSGTAQLTNGDFPAPIMIQLAVLDPGGSCVGFSVSRGVQIVSP